METAISILTSSAGMTILGILIGFIVDRFLVTSSKKKLVKAYAKAVALTLEEYDLPGDDAMLEMIYKLKAAVGNTDDVEKALLDEVTDLKEKNKK